MITAGLFGELARHMRKREPSMAQIDVVNGAFWKRHWDLDARIVKLQILAPHMIKTSMGQHYDEGQVHAANLLIQALVIGLYKAAAAKVNQWQLDENIGAQCTARSSAAAEEIVRCLKRATPASINRVCILDSPLRNTDELTPTVANLCWLLYAHGDRFFKPGHQRSTERTTESHGSRDSTHHLPLSSANGYIPMDAR